ncbi:MAG: sensor histidine kinase [Ruminiclostridium sp.]|nr:sensor histidine kinase [Ruminiclostridium sp.]
MLPEISLNILDVAQNSISAGAALTEITVDIDSVSDTLTVCINDDGCGMTEEQVLAVTDPFYTTRKTRKIGLGVPFFKAAAENTGGSFEIASEVGVGTKVKAVFGLSHIDRMPLGDMVFTIHTLVTLNSSIDFLYRYTVDGKSFTLDTRQFREILGDVPFNVPEVSEYIKSYLIENSEEVNGGRSF